MASLGCLMLAQCDAADLQPRSKRGEVVASGTLAARADLAARRPLALYTHVANGVVPGWQSPGLVGCSPTEAPNARFRIMADAEVNEGITLSPEHEKRAGAAVAFAAAYNREALRIRRAGVLIACPSANSDGARYPD